MENSIKYPAIILDRNNTVEIIKSNDDLTSCSDKALKNGFYKGLVIIDSSGKSLKIINAQKNKIKKFSIFLNHIISVDLEYDSKVINFSVSQFKEKIISMIEKKKGFWSSAWDINELKDEIDKAENYEDVMQLLV